MQQALAINGTITCCALIIIALVGGVVSWWKSPPGMSAEDEQRALELMQKIDKQLDDFHSTQTP